MDEVSALVNFEIVVTTTVLAIAAMVGRMFKDITEMKVTLQATKSYLSDHEGVTERLAAIEARMSLVEKACKVTMVTEEDRLSGL